MRPRIRKRWGQNASHSSLHLGPVSPAGLRGVRFTRGDRRFSVRERGVEIPQAMGAQAAVAEQRGGDRAFPQRVRVGVPRRLVVAPPKACARQKGEGVRPSDGPARSMASPHPIEPLHSDATSEDMATGANIMDAGDQTPNGRKAFLTFFFFFFFNNYHTYLDLISIVAGNF